MLEHERRQWAHGRHRVAGVDEAGRGPLAGPVVAAAVVMSPGYLEAEALRSLHGLTDSKKLTATQRGAFFAILCGDAARIDVGIGLADVADIERLNILRATHVAMRRAILDLTQPPDHALVDGLRVPDLPCPATFIVGGDRSSLLIAAASVVAKVTRDRMMAQYDREYPRYGFARNKGYGTREHTQALLDAGPCPIHRRTFAPVRDLAQIRLAIPTDDRKRRDNA